MNKFSLALLLAMTGTAGTALAGDALIHGGGSGPETPISFDEVDTDEDGFISNQEAAGNGDLSNSFSVLDENDDDRLSAEEFSDYRYEVGTDSSMDDPMY